jgi:hypothetical protein
MAQVRTPESNRWEIAGITCFIVAILCIYLVPKSLLAAIIIIAIFLGLTLYCIKKAKRALRNVE